MDSTQDKDIEFMLYLLKMLKNFISSDVVREKRLFCEYDIWALETAIVRYESVMAENKRYRDALEDIQHYARQCYRNKKAPMAWRLAEKTTEVLRGFNSDVISRAKH